MPGTHSQDVNQNLLTPKCLARWARTPGQRVKRSRRLCGAHSPSRHNRAPPAHQALRGRCPAALDTQD